MQAIYFDGKSTDGQPVQVTADAGRLRVRGGGVERDWPLAEVRASERIGASRRRLYFPDGAQCETADNDAVDAMFAAQTRTASRLLSASEGRLRYALIALVVTGLAAWAFRRSPGRPPSRCPRRRSGSSAAMRSRRWTSSC
jgi:hypothetical protein